MQSGRTEDEKKQYFQAERGTKIENAREGRMEGWVDPSNWLALHMCTYPWHQSYDASARKRKENLPQFLLSMQLFCPPFTAHNVRLSPRIKLAGWVRMFPHPVQFEKTMRYSPTQPVPAASASSASPSFQHLLHNQKKWRAFTSIFKQTVSVN